MDSSSEMRPHHRQLRVRHHMQLGLLHEWLRTVILNRMHAFPPAIWFLARCALRM